MTPIEPIEAQALTYIKNDLSLDWDIRNRTAVFYNRMYQYFRWGVGYFNRPPEMMEKLRYTAPVFEDLNYTPETGMSAPVTIATGKTGYDICSCGLIDTDAYGNPTYKSVNCTYNSTTGDVVINTYLGALDTVSINFYKSGSIEADLTETEKSILAFAIYAAWEHRFDNNAIERTAKIRDSSFTTISEASQTNANTARQREVMEELYGMMRQYEQNRAYLKAVRV